VIQGAVFCPHPPLLVPQVAQGAAPELDDLRGACRTAIRRVAPRGPIVVLGSGSGRQAHPPTARGTLAGFGVPLEIGLGSDTAGAVELPLSLTIGAWLLRDALGPESGATGWSVGPDGEHDPSLLAAGEKDCVLLVMGDGSARRSIAAPGYLDERAAEFDADVAAALRSGSGDRLAVDLELGDELLASGPRVWREAARLLGAAEFNAELLYDAAPYGVGYFVAAWTRADERG
jgi:hypothetical protein